MATLAVQSRNLAAAMLLLHGVEGAQAAFQRTILDSKMAGEADQ